MVRQLYGPGEWWCFLRVLLFAAVVPLLFRLKLSILSQWLERRVETVGLPAVESQTCERILRCVELAMTVGRPLVRPSCLVRGVTRYYFLRRAGLNLTLCFGAAMKAGEFVEAPGHCWLEHDGKTFLEPSDPRRYFLPIYRLPRAFNVRSGSAEGA